MEDKKNQDLKLKELEKALQEQEGESLIKSIKKLESEGQASLLPLLIKRASENEDEAVQKAIENILFSLKDSKSHPVLLEELKKMPAIEFRKTLLAAIWNSKIDALPILDDLIRIAIEGDYYEAIEVYTILDESEGEIIEERVLDALLLMNEYKNSPDYKNDPKKELIDQIASKLDLLNQGII